jgi:oxalate decarboxylase/phosphoglucose isomerase-like protein (cupin superfamily)
MAKNAIVSDELAKKFATEKETPYTRWVRAEGLDIIGAHYVANLNTVELKPWARRGGSGVYINHEASRTSNDCYVCEIPPAKSLAPQRQLFEEMILVLSGRGSTSVWNDAGQRITFEWKAGAMFAIEPDYFSAKGEQKGLLLETNFVADAVNLPLIAAKERGAGGGHIRFNMAKGSMNSHISQFPTATYKKAHAHGPGAHVIILSGEGYSLMWPEGDEPRRYEWQVGTMVVPPNMWFHQHFNTGTTPARYLAFKHEGVAIRNAQGVPKAWISRRAGGDQIDYADEQPVVRTIFAQELARRGLSSRMDQAYAAEMADLPQAKSA